MTSKLYILLSALIVANCAPPPSSDLFEFAEDAEGPTNYQLNEVNSRSLSSLEDVIADYLTNYVATFKLPLIDSKITFGARNLEKDELNMKLSFSNPTEIDARGKKSKLKKIFVPLFIIMLLKVITLIPLALGILGLKTWNALQLSFVTFVISISMAVFQLCKKLATDHTVPSIAAHGPWDPHSAHVAARSFEDGNAQKLAYAAYEQ